MNKKDLNKIKRDKKKSRTLKKKVNRQQGSKKVVMYVKLLIDFKTKNGVVRQNHVVKTIKVHRKDVDASPQLLYNHLKTQEVYEKEMTGNYIVEICVPSVQVPSLNAKKMKSLKVAYTQYFGLDILPREDSMSDESNCVIDYIASKNAQLKSARPEFKLEKVKEEFLEMGFDLKHGLSYNDVVEWIERYHKGNVSVTMYDPLNIKVAQKVYKHSNLSLHFINNNGHCYGIHNTDIIKSVSQLKEIKMVLDKRALNVYVSKDESVDILEKITDGVYETDKNIIIDSLYLHRFNDQVHCLPTEKLNFRLEHLIWKIVEKHKLMPFNIHIDKNFAVASFHHPISGQRVEITDSYEQRKAVMDILMKKYNKYQFDFDNQSFAEIGVSLFHEMFGRWSSESFSTQATYDINTTYRTRPLTWGNPNDQLDEAELQMYDYAKCYPNSMLELDADTPVFAICDLWEKYNGEPIQCGEYLLRPITLIGGIEEECQIASYDYVQYLLDEGYIEKTDILLRRHASFSTSHTYIQRFAEQTIQLLGESLARDVLIHWIGKMGKMETEQHKSCITNSDDYVLNLLRQHQLSDCVLSDPINDIEVPKSVDIRFQVISDDYIALNYVKRARMTHDCAPILRQVYCRAKRIMIRCIKQMFIPGKSIIRTVRTDGISGWNLGEAVEKMRVKSVQNLRKTVRARPVPKFVPYMKSWNKLIDVHYENDYMRLDGRMVDKTEGEAYLKTLLGKSMYISGDGGLQKSVILTRLFQLYKDRKMSVMTTSSVMATSLTHRNCSLLRKSVDKESRGSIMVLKRMFDITYMRKRPDVLFVDEFSQIGIEWYRYFQSWKEQGTVIVMVGDLYQTTQISDLPRFFDLYNRRFFRELCDYNIMKKKYIATCSRNDPKLMEVIEHLKETGLLHPMLKNCKPVDYMNVEVSITNTQKTKKMVNDYWSQKLGEWGAGRRVTGCRNEFGIFNGMNYKVVSCNGDTVEVKDDDGNRISTFRKCLEEGYADTVYRRQGDKIDEEGNIMDMDQLMTMNKLITGLGRFTKLDYIRLNWTDRKFYLEKEDKNATNIGVRQCLVGYIYKIYYHKEKLVYVGETERTIEQRMQDRIRSNEYPISEYGSDFTVECVATVNYFSSDELKQIETMFINKSIACDQYKNINRDVRGTPFVKKKKTVQIVKKVPQSVSAKALPQKVTIVKKVYTIVLKEIEPGRWSAHIENMQCKIGKFRGGDVGKQKALDCALKVLTDNQIMTYTIEERKYE